MKKIACRRFMELRIRKVDSTGTLTTVAGYPSVLRTVDIPLMTPEDCRENSFGTREVVHQRTLCAGVEGKGIWAGDSGGPLVVSLPDGAWAQVGVTSMEGRGTDQTAVKIQHKARAVPSGSCWSVWHDLASLDEVVKGGTGDVQDLGN